MSDTPMPAAVRRSWKWYGQMAFRDSRRQRMRLLLFMSSIVLGIAALVAINSFSRNLSAQIDEEAKALLGADLEITSRQPLADSVHAFLDSFGLRTIEEISFASMVRFGNKGTRLVNVRAVENGFPLYGKMETMPEAGAANFYAGQNSLADNTLLLQFGIKQSDTLYVGLLPFLVAGSVEKLPGQTGIASTVAPPVFIPMRFLAATGLLQKGSRLNYTTYVKFPDGFSKEVYENNIKPALESFDLRYDDVEERKKEVGEAYKDLSSFLNLIAFVALLLGCIGVGSSVHIYIKEKKQAVAILRCLGASSADAMRIFWLQVGLLALAGAFAGALLGSLLQLFLPLIFADFLPVEVSPKPSAIAIIQGVLLGVVSALVFAIAPLVAIRKVSPLMAIRADYSTGKRQHKAQWYYLLAPLFILLFAWWQLRNLQQAIWFSLGIVAAFGLLALLAKLVVWLAQKIVPSSAPFTLRQAVANLYRPNNQTLILVSTIGLGTALIATLMLVQNLLVNKVSISASGSRPNMVVFDIQDNQVDTLRQITKEFGLPDMGVVPIVNMRLESLKGKTVASMKEDTTIRRRRGWLTREYRVTYRDTLIESEKLVKGEWHGVVESPSDSIFISIDEGMAEDLDIVPGDEMIWNVQGAMIKTYVGSFRQIDFQRVQTNFLVLFPNGVLEGAPKFHVLLSRFDSVAQSAAYQQAVVKRYPNVSIIDLNLILQTIDEVLGKVSFVIRFMAFFSILTGLIVLMGALRISKVQRLHESVLLRTLGASRKQIVTINLLEYFMLGSLAALTGLLIAVAFSVALAKISFDTVLVLDVSPLLIAWLLVAGITVFIGWLNNRGIGSTPPLAILRSEG